MRNGKIARLPYNIRQCLNLRMRDGEDGPATLDWLNSLPEVQETLKAGFNGVPVSKQNLCEWRQGGFREWEMRHELLHQADELTAWTNDLDEVVDTPLLAGDLVAMIATRYAAFLNSWDGEPDEKTLEKLRLLRGLTRDLALLQRTMCLANKHKNEYHQRLEEQEDQEEQKHKGRCLERLFAPFREESLAKAFGGGEGGRLIAKTILAIRNDWPLPEVKNESPPGRTRSKPVKPKTENDDPSSPPPSTPVKPESENEDPPGQAQIKRLLSLPAGKPGGPLDICQRHLLSLEAGSVKPSQTQSNHLFSPLASPCGERARVRGSAQKEATDDVPHPTTT